MSTRSMIPLITLRACKKDGTIKISICLPFPLSALTCTHSLFIPFNPVFLLTFLSLYVSPSNLPFRPLFRLANSQSDAADELLCAGNIKPSQSPHFTCSDLQLLMLFGQHGNSCYQGRAEALQPRFYLICLCMSHVLIQLQSVFACLMSLHVFLSHTRALCLQRVPPTQNNEFLQRCSVTAAGSHQPGGQVLLSGSGAAFNER